MDGLTKEWAVGQTTQKHNAPVQKQSWPKNIPGHYGYLKAICILNCRL